MHALRVCVFLFCFVLVYSVCWFVESIVFGQDGPRIVQSRHCTHYAVVGIPEVQDKSYVRFSFMDLQDTLESGYGVINIGDYVEIYFDLNSDSLEDRICLHKLEMMYLKGDTLYHFPDPKFDFMWVDEDFDGDWDLIHWMKGPYGKRYTIPFDHWKEWIDSLYNAMKYGET